MKNPYDAMRGQIMDMQTWFAENHGDSRDPDVRRAIFDLSRTRSILDILAAKSKKKSKV